MIDSSQHEVPAMQPAARDANISQRLPFSAPPERTGIVPGRHDQHRGMASNRGERLTVHQKKKTSRALARARRLRNASMATVLGGEEWTEYEATMRQGLRELDDTTEVKRRGTYASKPLVSAVWGAATPADSTIAPCVWCCAFIARACVCSLGVVVAAASEQCPSTGSVS